MNKATLVVGTAILSFAAGSISSYFYARERLLKAFDLAVEDQVEKELTAIARRLIKSEQEMRDATTKLQQMEDLVGDIQRDPIVVDLDPKEKVFYNTVLPAAKQFALEHAPPEIARDALKKYQGIDPESQVEVSMDHPYQITDGMFQEAGYDQIQLTYYEGDGILSDDRDDVIEDPAPMVGLEFSKWFGDLSGDPNVVFIRNGAREVDFEITRSEGSYGVEVAGELPDPEHRG